MNTSSNSASKTSSINFAMSLGTCVILTTSNREVAVGSHPSLEGTFYFSWLLPTEATIVGLRNIILDKGDGPLVEVTQNWVTVWFGQPEPNRFGLKECFLHRKGGKLFNYDQEVSEGYLRWYLRTNLPDRILERIGLD